MDSTATGPDEAGKGGFFGVSDFSAKAGAHKFLDLASDVWWKCLPQRPGTRGHNLKTE